jgi:hypothetical protein
MKFHERSKTMGITIEEYATGMYMKVEGETHRSDLKIIDEDVKGNWWRKEGHRLDSSDIEDVLAASPETLVIGTGYAGNMQVPEATRSVLSDHGIRTIAQNTRDAVETFNQMKDEGRDVAGAFHLTC